MCQHDINLKNSTVVLSKRMCLIHPFERQGVCKKCFADLTYRRTQDGKYVLKEVEHEDSRSDL